jgi:hypothetical protein
MYLCRFLGYKTRVNNIYDFENNLAKEFGENIDYVDPKSATPAQNNQTNHFTRKSPNTFALAAW